MRCEWVWGDVACRVLPCRGCVVSPPHDATEGVRCGIHLPSDGSLPISGPTRRVERSLYSTLSNFFFCNPFQLLLLFVCVKRILFFCSAAIYVHFVHIRLGWVPKNKNVRTKTQHICTHNDDVMPSPHTFAVGSLYMYMCWIVLTRTLCFLHCPAHCPPLSLFVALSTSKSPPSHTHTMSIYRFKRKRH